MTDWKQSKDDAFFNYDETCGDPTNAAWSTGANALTLVTAGVVYVAGFTFQVAYESSSSILGAMQEGTGADDGALPKLVSTLTDSLYLEFFNIMVMLAAIWMGYKGLVKRQSTEMAQGAVWMFGAAIVGMFMLANPLMVSNAVNTAVMTVSEAGVSAIATSSTKALTGNDSDGLCYTNVAGNGADAKGDALKTSTRGIVRGMQCSLWESFLYTPWTQGQFGHLEGETAPNGVNYIVGSTGQPGQYGSLAKETPALKDAALPKTISMGGRDIPANWARLQLDSKVSHRLDEGDSAKLTLKQGRTMLEIASSQTMRSNPNIAWTGKTSINRVFLSILALVSALGAGAMVMVLSMEMIILQIGLILLALLLPVFALVGVHPGFGRRVALRYFNTIGELTLRRIVLSILLAVMVTVYAVVLRTASMSWMVAMIMVVAVSIAGIAYKNKVMGMFEGAMNVGGVGAANLRGVNAMTDRSLLYAAKQGKRGAKQAARPVNAVGRGVLAVGAGAGTALVSNAMRQESSIDTAKMGGGAGSRPKRNEVEFETPTNNSSSANVPKQRDADGPQGTPVVKREGHRGSEGGSGARVDIQKHSEREPHIEDAHAPVMARVDAQSATNPLPEVRRDETVDSAPQTTVQGTGEKVTPGTVDTVTTAPEVRRDGSTPVSDKTVVSIPEASSKDGQTATPRMDGLRRPERPQGAQLGGVASQRPAGLPELHPEHDGMGEDVPVRQLHVGGRARSLPTWTELATDAQDTPEQLASPRVQKVAPEQSKAVDSDAKNPVAQKRPAMDNIQGVPQRTSEAAQGTAGEQEVHTTSRVIPPAQKATQAPSHERQTTAGDVGSPEQHTQGNTAAETASATTPQAPPVRPSGEAFRARAERVVGPPPVKPSAARRAWGDFVAGAQGSRGKGLKVVSRSVQQRKRDVAREQRALNSWEWQVGKVQSELRSAWNAEDPTTYPDALPEKPEEEDGETRKK